MERDHEKYKSFIKNYWRYYRELEDELLETRRFVDFHRANFSTYSVEYLKLYQAVCSEIDVLGKAMASEVNNSFQPTDSKNNILKWWFEIQDNFILHINNSGQTSSEVKMREFEVSLFDDVSFIPWDGFVSEQYTVESPNQSIRYRANNSLPRWWSDYNKVKHARFFLNTEQSNYTKANLGNVCEAFAALYVLEKAYMEAIGTESDLQSFADISKLFDNHEIASGDEIDALFP